MGQQERREHLAETARAEVAEHIRNNPGKWLVEIVRSIEEPEEFIRACIVEYATSHRIGQSAIEEAIDKLAEQAGQSAYDCIISHPGAGL